MTTGSNPNLSLATPYSFTITQSALTPTNITWKVTWKGFTDQNSWGVFNGAPSGSSINYLLTMMDTITLVYSASDGANVNDTSSPGRQVRVKPGRTVQFYMNNSGDRWSRIGSLTVPSVSKTNTI